VESGLDCSGGGAQDGCDFGHWAFLKVMEDDHGPVVERESGKGSIE
jgi:hypothetical protein